VFAVVGETKTVTILMARDRPTPLRLLIRLGNQGGGRSATRIAAEEMPAPAGFSSHVRRVRPIEYGVLAAFQNAAPTTLRMIVARVERGFAEFAEIPYQDVITRQELSQILDEFGSDAPRFRPAGRRADQRVPRPGD
jgi:hypothetical protein